MEKILNIVRFKSKGMTITELSRHTNIHRNSIAKYLQILLASGKVDVQLVGNAKVYTISKRVPMSSMLSFTSDFVVLINKEGNILDVNDRYLDYFNLKKEDLLNQLWSDLDLPIIKHPEVKPLVIAGLEDGEKSGYEIIFDKSGRELNFYINIIPIVLDGGGKGLFLFMQDFTAQKIAEEAMVESEEKFHNLFNNALDAILLYEINDDGLIGNLLEVNEIASKKLMYGYDELLNMPARSIIVPDSWDISSQIDQELAEQYNSIFTGFLIKKDSKNIPVEISSQIFELNGRLVVLFIVRDVTKWKETQKKLEISQNRYRGIIETQKEIICRYYPDGTYSFVNDAFCRYFNKKREDILEKSELFKIPFADREIIQSGLGQISIDNPAVNYEHRVIMEDNSVRWIQWNNTGTFNDSGEIAEYQLVGRDISDQKKAEQALKQSEEVSRILLDESKNSAIMIDKNGNILGYNKKIFSCYDLRVDLDDPGQESIRGKNYSEIFSSEDSDYFSLAVENCINNKNGGFFNKKKNSRTYHMSYYPIFDENEDIARIAFFKHDITKIKQMEDSLTGTIKKLSEIIEFLPEATFAVDLNKKVIAWNKAMEKLTNIRKEDILEMSGIYFTPFYKESGNMLIDQLIKEKDYINLDQSEKNALTKIGYFKDVFDGKGAYLWSKTSYLYDDSGLVVGAIQTLRDITQLKMTRNALEKSEMRYRAVVEEHTDMICRFSMPDKKISFVNKELCRNFNFTPEELTGQDISIIFPENVCREIRAIKLNFFVEGQASYYETRIVDYKGNSFWQEWKINPIIDKNNYLVEFQCVGRDITDKKETEISLRGSEKKYRDLIETSKSIIIKLNNKGKITFINEFGESVYGYSRDEVIGKDFSGTLAPEIESNGRDTREFIREVCENPELYNISENEGITKNNKLLWISWSFSLIKDKKIKDDGILCIGSDITEKKKFEELQKLSENNLDTLHKSAVKLSEMSGLNSILEYISVELKNIVPYAVANISILNKNSGMFEIYSFKGSIDGYEGICCDMMELNLHEHKYRLPEGYAGKLLNEKILVSENGVYGLFQESLPLYKCNTINNILNIGKCYTKGLYCNNKLYGLISFAIHGGENMYETQTFEIFTNLVSMAIQKEYSIQNISSGKNGNAIPLSEKNHTVNNLIRFERQITKKCIDCIPKPTLTVDINGKITTINIHGCDYLKCSESVALGEYFYNLLPEDLQNDARIIHHKLTNGSMESNLTLFAKNNDDRNNDYSYSWKAQKITDDLGNMKSLLWIGDFGE
ncbi:PAS domain S-box protein [Methanochimaera problematica]|uniref:PAS domain S-box protein n=1 Tax=Methanochimaera problematica TaxID=2609417 RepID=UPI00293932F6|nr:PAS domain S-box protein [Methanoplanus sp. FWC-SCC4]